MTFREYCQMAIAHDFEFDAVIGGEDMPATFSWCDDMVFTPYCEEKYGKMLDSKIIIRKDPIGKYTETVEVLFDDATIGKQFTWAVAGYVAESEYDKLFYPEAKGEQSC